MKIVKIFAYTAAGAILAVAVVIFLFRTDPTPEPPSTAGTIIEPHTSPDSESGLVNLLPQTASISDHGQNESMEGQLPQFTASGESSAVNNPEKHPYSPSAEELRLFYDLKGKVFLQGMTMRRLLALDEFTALPESMQLQFVSDVVQMVNDGQLDGRQFIQELPPSDSHDPRIANENVSRSSVTTTRQQNRQRLQQHLQEDRSVSPELRE